MLPLLSRAEFSRRHPQLFFDPQARRAADALGALPGAPDTGGWSGLLYALRQDALCEAAGRYIDCHPRCAVVDLGCGLDSALSRLDDGRRPLLGIDLPEVIELRRRLMPPSAREELLGADARDLSWLGRVDGRGGLCVLAGGLFCYFREAELRELLCALAARFPGGRVCFDCESPSAARLSRRLLRRLGLPGERLRLSVGRAEELFRPWSADFADIRELRRPPEKYLRRGALPMHLRAGLRLSMGLGLLKFVEIDFRE